MTPEEFIALWKDNKLTERGGAQAHFDDLCDLLGVDNGIGIITAGSETRNKRGG
jgi:hypothetical protein